MMHALLCDFNAAIKGLKTEISGSNHTVGSCAFIDKIHAYDASWAAVQEHLHFIAHPVSKNCAFLFLSELRPIPPILK